ncbi:hypothetical protein ACHAWF_008132 [Thalassiosira exigua]
MMDGPHCVLSYDKNSRRNHLGAALIFFACTVLNFRLVASLSTASTPPSPEYAFRSFEFDPLTGICRRPSSFQYREGGGASTQYFVMRNTPGDGDCVFHAVLSSVFISMGMLDPDSGFSNMSSMALEMRSVVAKYLASPEGNLYVNNKPRKRIVRCRDLLQSAANNEGMSTDEYLIKLRQPGKQGGLYGGGPELTVLSNILRRPISIYHLKHTTEEDFCEIERMGVFGEGLLEDPGRSVPDSVISNAVFFTLDGRAGKNEGSALDKTVPNMVSPIGAPLKCSWHLHILIADAGQNEKHATVLLPSVPILHTN